jgi:hypothetical protein
VKKVALAILIMSAAFTIYCDTLKIKNSEMIDTVFQTQRNIHGPVKTVKTIFSDFLPSDMGNSLTTEYFPNGKIKSSQFFIVYEDMPHLLTIMYHYYMGILTSISYHSDGIDIMSSSLTVDDHDIIHMSQIKDSDVYFGYIFDTDGKFYFDLIPVRNGNNRRSLWKIINIDNGWFAQISGEDKNVLRAITYRENNGLKVYNVTDNGIGFNMTLEINYNKKNTVEINFRDSGGKYSFKEIFQYTKFDEYGNWIECIESSLGLEQLIMREYEYYDS